MIQACREDIDESIKLKRQLEGYQLGAYSGGHGPLANELQRRRHLDQKKQAAEFCKELDAYVESGRVEEGASATAGKSNLEKCIAPKRNTWSSNFQRVLKIAKLCRNSFHVATLAGSDYHSYNRRNL